MTIAGAAVPAASRTGYATGRGGDWRRAFVLTCAAYFAALVGTQITAFALGVWVFQRTGSISACGAVAAAVVAPAIVAAPLAGTLVDRAPRRALLAGYSGAAACTAALAVLLYVDAVGYPGLLGIVALASAFKSVQFPGLSALTQRLVPSTGLGRANGVVQLGSALAQVAAPLAASALLVSGSVWAVIAAEAVALGASAAFSALTRLPPGAAPPARGGPARIAAGVVEGWRFIRRSPALATLLALVVVTNFNVGAAQVLLAPLVLGFADAAVLGDALSAGGIGMLIAGALLVLWSGRAWRVHGVIGSALCEGASIVALGAMHPSPALVTACAFGAYFAVPVLGACSQVIWQRAVPLGLQGAVAGVRFLATQSVLPIAQLAAGPLVEHVFDPLVASRGEVAHGAGAALAGHPKGIAYMLVAVGTLSAMAAVAAATSGPFQRLDKEGLCPPSAVPGS